MATFSVQSTLRLSAQRGVFVVGTITDGTIEKGMVARTAKGGSLLMGAPIIAIEFVDTIGEASQVALHCASSSEASAGEAFENQVEALCKDGATIEFVTPPTATV